MPNRTTSRKRRISNVWTIWALVIVLAWGVSIFATVASAADPKTPLLKLTEEEKAWLAAHKTIRLGVNLA